MKKYAVVNWEYICVDIIEVSNIDTLDGYELPEGPCILVPSGVWSNEAQIGLHFNSETNSFQ
jgi:hypothetical protein